MSTEEKDWLEDLEAAYEGAEVGTCDVGDTIILPSGGGGYIIRTAVDWDPGAPEGWGVRILKRAPKPEPKPFAVMASKVNSPDKREVFMPSEIFVSEDNWESPTTMAYSDQLVDPAPLVEVPDIDAVREALEQPYMREGREWPGSIPLARAVLELLEGKR